MEKLDYQNEMLAGVVYTFLAFILLATVLILFFYFSRKRIIKYYKEKQEVELNYQKDLLNAVLLTQEEERKRIARDLHDDISSKLNVVCLNGFMLKNSKELPAHLETFSNNILQMTNEAIDSARTMAHDLLPPVLEKFGLDSAIEGLCDDFNRSKMISVSYNNLSELAKLDGIKQLHIYRIIQELMNNSVRHGKAKNISIIIEKDKFGNICRYKDDGLGFDTSDDNKQNGLGMKNIKSRINFLSGTFKLTSEVNEGVQIEFTFS